MRKSLLAAGLAALMAIFTINTASAGDRGGINHRQHNQSKRIFNGVKNGSLNRREAGRLIRGSARIHRKERRFKSDGVFTRRERLRTHRSLNRQSRRIFRLKHN